MFTFLDNIDMQTTVAIGVALFLVALWGLNKWLGSTRGRGYIGERSVVSALRKLDQEIYTILPDVMLRKRDGDTSQIDALVVSIYGIFVIEAKNYTGIIKGKVTANRWRQFLHSKTNPYYFQNPLHQNYGHMKTIEEVMHIPFNKMHTVIVFAGTAKWRKRPAVSVVYTKEVKDYILSKRNVLFTEDEVKDIKTQISELKVTGVFRTSEHVARINENINNSR